MWALPSPYQPPQNTPVVYLKQQHPKLLSLPGTLIWEVMRENSESRPGSRKGSSCLVPVDCSEQRHKWELMGEETSAWPREHRWRGCTSHPHKGETFWWVHFPALRVTPWPCVHIDSDELSPLRSSHPVLRLCSSPQCSRGRKHVMTIPKDSFSRCPAVYNVNIWKVIIPGGAKRPGQHKTDEGTETQWTEQFSMYVERRRYPSVPEYRTHWRESKPARD